MELKTIPSFFSFWKQNKFFLIGGQIVSEQDIKQKVFELVSEHLGVDIEKITDDTSFINDLGADSLDIVELVMDLEEEFDVKIPEDIADKIQTVGDAVKFIASESANN